MKNEQLLYCLSLLVIFFIANQITVVQASTVENITEMDEAELKVFMNDNPDYVAFDIRWDEKYERGHLEGAYLINSGQERSDIYNEAIGILNELGVGKDTPIISYCNCGGGHLGLELSEDLEAVGYTNLVYLSKSMQLWSDYEVLVEGPNRYGDFLTAPQDSGDDGNSALWIIGIGSILVVFSIAGFFLFLRPGSANTEEIQSKSKEKQSKQLDSLQQIITERKNVKSKHKKYKKPKR